MAKYLPAGTLVALTGTLGAGKTRLVRAVAEELGVAEGKVQSPTFVLIREYAGQRPVYHFDAYRLRDEDEFLQLGPDEYFDSDGLSFVEWADKVENCLPPEKLKIDVQVLDTAERLFILQACGGFPNDVLKNIETYLTRGSDV